MATKQSATAFLPALLGSILGLALAAAPGGAAQAAEIKVMTSVALTAALDELKPQFEQARHDTLAIEYALISDLRKRILAGETADVIILSRPVMDELQNSGKLAPGAVVDVAGTPVAVAVRAGAPKPDIGSADALKKTLLAAKSIVYADPAKGGASGVYFAQVLDRIGLTEAMKGKTILVPGAQSADVVARGEAELGIGQSSEIVPVSGAQMVGPLPGELGHVTVFSAALGAGTAAPEKAKALIDFLTGPKAAPVLEAKGFEPG